MSQQTFQHVNFNVGIYNVEQRRMLSFSTTSFTTSKKRCENDHFYKQQKKLFLIEYTEFKVLTTIS